MADYVTRYAHNPIVTAEHVQAGRSDFVVEGVLNPGAFTYQGRIGLLLRGVWCPVLMASWLLGVPAHGLWQQGGPV